MIESFCRVEVSLGAGGVEAASYFGGEDIEVGVVERVEASPRGLTQGIFVNPFEVCASDARGEEQWSLRALRRGLKVGFGVLCAEGGRCVPDPLWTVGRLGRDHLPEEGEGERGYEGGLFAYGDSSRILLDDDEGELWASVESRAGASSTRIIKRWDGVTIGELVQTERDETGWVIEVRGREWEMGLERLALEVGPVLLVVFSGRF